jgi:hypothetical protein
MDYADYVEAQSHTNRAKFTRTSLTRDEAAAVARYYRSTQAAALARRNFFGLCLGIRNGAEIRAFSHYLGRRITGIDISDTVLQVPDGFLCDFTFYPALWKGKVDFMYSNSYDHASDLSVTLSSWADLLAPDGLMFLQFTRAHAHDMKTDLEGVLRRLRAAGFAVQEVMRLMPDHRAHQQLASVCSNAVRYVSRNVLAPLVPNTRALHWRLKYNLRRGLIDQSEVIVAKR